MPGEKEFKVGKGIKGKQRAVAYAQAMWSEVIGTEPPEVERVSFSERKNQLREYRERARDAGDT